MKSLGITLKEARERNGFTLREVDKATGISSAYLSQLENDHAKNPSASMLYKLASLYGEELNNLLRAAGIISGPIEAKTKPSSEELLAKQIAFYAKDLSNEQKEEIIEYIRMKIKLNKKNG